MTVQEIHPFRDGTVTRVHFSICRVHEALKQLRDECSPDIDCWCTRDSIYRRALILKRPRSRL